MFFLNYFQLIFFITFSIFVAIFILIISLFLSFKPFNANVEIGSSYECGYIPFSDSRMKFDVQFYLVAILFVLFDIEVCLLLPWSVVVLNCGFTGFGVIFVFFIILGNGFLIEWRSGVLNLNF